MAQRKKFLLRIRPELWEELNRWAAAEFRSAHLPGAGNIEPGDIGQRIHELPRKGEELYVVGGAPARAAAVALQERQRWELAWSDEPVSEVTTQDVLKLCSSTRWETATPCATNSIRENFENGRDTIP